MVKKITFIAGSLLLSTQTFAQDSKELSGFSLSAGAGIARHTIDASGGFEEDSGTDTAFSFAASYTFNPNWTASVAYIDYGEAELFTDSGTEVIDSNVVQVRTSINSSTTGIAAYVNYHSERVVKGFSYGASLGLISWSTEINVDFSASNGDVTFSDSDTIIDDNGVSVYGGVYASYAVSQHFDITASATWFVNDLESGDIVDGETLDMQHGLFGLVATYSF